MAYGIWFGLKSSQILNPTWRLGFRVFETRWKILRSRDSCDVMKPIDEGCSGWRRKKVSRWCITRRKEHMSFLIYAYPRGSITLEWMVLDPSNMSMWFDTLLILWHIYCWWKKSQTTTWDVYIPVNNAIDMDKLSTNCCRISSINNRIPTETETYLAKPGFLAS